MNKGYIDEKLSPPLKNWGRGPIHNKILQMKKLYDIVSKYRLVMEGIGQFYYSHITYWSTLIKIYYFLKWSYYKILANRFKCTTAQIRKKFGRNVMLERRTEFLSKKTGNKEISTSRTYMPD